MLKVKFKKNTNLVDWDNSNKVNWKKNKAWFPNNLILEGETKNKLSYWRVKLEKNQLNKDLNK